MAWWWLEFVWVGARGGELAQEEVEGCVCCLVRHDRAVEIGEVVIGNRIVGFLNG